MKTLLEIKLSSGDPKRDTLANSADPDQMPHNVASDQVLQCLLTGFSIKNRIKVIKRPDNPTNDKWTHPIITVEESTRIQWVKEH